MRPRYVGARDSRLSRFAVTAPRYSAGVRILHTSDWHLGRSFHGASLLHEQKAVIDRLVVVAAEAQVDLVVIAGDLYDRAIPPADAVKLFDDALVRLRATGAKIVAIVGNHDSPSRVAVADRVLEQAGVTIRGDVSRCLQPVPIDVDDNGPPVLVYPVPYLEPSLADQILNELGAMSSEVSDIADSEAEDPEITDRWRTRRPCHHDVTAQATALIRRHATAAGATRTIVVAHTFVNGGMTTDSERDLSIGSIGNIDHVGLNVFDGFDYVALGHLHRSQHFDKGRIAYSGSPLAYSFSEEDQIKSVRIVEMDAAGHCSTEIIPLGVGLPLRTLCGQLDDLLRDPAFDDAEQARVRIQLTDPELPLQAMTRLQVRFPHAAALEHHPDGRASPGGDDVAEAVESSEQPLELTFRFWADQHGADASDDQKRVLASALKGASGANEI